MSKPYFTDTGLLVQVEESALGSAAARITIDLYRGQPIRIYTSGTEGVAIQEDAAHGLTYGHQHTHPERYEAVPAEA